MLNNGIVIGASHMKRVVRILEAKGVSVPDMSVSGWVASAHKITSLTKQLEDLRVGSDTVVVLDLVGNSSVLFKQADDSLALPCKINGKWHLLGDVAVVEDGDLGEQLRKLASAVKKIEFIPKVFVPPIPRYVFGGCCSSPEHASNTKHAEHSWALYAITR